jgi:hypothetical protein
MNMVTSVFDVACKTRMVLHLQVALKTRRHWYGKDHHLVVEMEECLADVWADTAG